MLIRCLCVRARIESGHVEISPVRGKNKPAVYETGPWEAQREVSEAHGFPACYSVDGVERIDSKFMTWSQRQCNRNTTRGEGRC